MFAILEDEEKWPGDVGTSAQQFDDVRMADIFEEMKFRQEIGQFGGNRFADISTAYHRRGRFGHLGSHDTMASYSGDGSDGGAHNLSEFTFAQRRFLIDDEPLAWDFPLAICRLIKLGKKKFNDATPTGYFHDRIITEIPNDRNDMFCWTFSSAPLRRLSSM